MKSQIVCNILTILFVLCGQFVGSIKAQVFELDRGSAAKLIQDSEEFFQPETYQIDLVQGGMKVEQQIKMMMSIDRTEGQLYNSSYGCLYRGGYIEIRDNKRDVFGSDFSGQIVTLTEKGKAIGSTDREPDARTEPLEYTFSVADRALLGVTGIKYESDNSAVVLFEWDRKYNDLGKCMITNDPVIREGTAVLGKYDDGWRVERMYHRSEDYTEGEPSSQVEEPSESIIKDAISEALQYKIPVTLSSFLGDTKNVDVSSIRVIAIGKVQVYGSMRFWPVKVYVEGSFDASTPFGEVGRKRLKGEAEYRIFQDPYGDWKATTTSI